MLEYVKFQIYLETTDILVSISSLIYVKQMPIESPLMLIQIHGVVTNPVDVPSLCSSTRDMLTERTI